VINMLSRAQRLTVADELAADAASRSEALRILPTGQEPAANARAWQTCEVTRSLRNGQTGPLPEGAAAWLVRGWGPDHSPAERWPICDRLDPMLAHLVVPHGDDMVDDEVFYVSGHDEHRNLWDSSPHAPMTVTRSGSRDRQSEILGELDPHDDDGFARALGEWTRLVPYRP
jgi:hypothetical protein